MSKRRPGKETRKHDGDLTEAFAHLYAAIDTLTEPRIEWADNRVVTVPGLYEQLQTMIAGMQGTGNGSAARSMPPIWVDAVDILTDIETALDAWHLPELPRPQPRYVSGTTQRLRELGKRSWRPQDTKTVESITKALEEWAADIESKLDPPRKLHIAAACPACGETTAKRTDRAGERVNVPALSVDDDGCTCQECHAHWPPALYRHLCRVLGMKPADEISA